MASRKAASPKTVRPIRPTPAVPATLRRQVEREAASEEDVGWERLELWHDYESEFAPYEQLGHVVDRFERTATRSSDHTRTGRSKLPGFDVVVAKVLAGVALAASRADREGLRTAYRWADAYLADNQVGSAPVVGGKPWPPATALSECDAVAGRALPNRRRAFERLLRAATRGLRRFEGLPASRLALPAEDRRIAEDAETVARSMARVARAAGFRVTRGAEPDVRGEILRMLPRARGPVWFKLHGPELLVRIALVAFGVVASRDAARDWCKGATSRSEA